MPSIAPGHRYPDSNAWVSISDVLINGWATGASTRYLKAMALGNTATLNGSVVIGTSLTAGTIPDEYRPAITESFTGFLRGYGPIELQMTANGLLFIPSFTWPGDAYLGGILLFTYSYQRKA